MTSEAISDHADLSDENATEKDVRVNREVMQGQSSTALSPTPETVSDKEAQRVPTLGDDEETVVPRLPKSKIAFLALTLFSTAFLGVREEHIILEIRIDSLIDCKRYRIDDSDSDHRCRLERSRTERPMGEKEPYETSFSI